VSEMTVALILSEIAYRSCKHCSVDMSQTLQRKNKKSQWQHELQMAE